MDRKLTLLGLSVLVAVGLLLWLAQSIGTLRTKDGKRYTVSFDDAAGVNVDSPIRVAGVNVGKVEEVELVDGRARLSLVMLPEIELHTDALAQVRAKSLLGEKFLLVEPGSLDAPLLPDGGEIVATRSSFEIDEALNALEPILGGESILAAFEPIAARIERLRADPDEPEPEPDEPIETREQLAEAIAEVRTDVREAREQTTEAKQSIHTALADANAALESRKLDRALTDIDKFGSTTAKHLPALFDTGEDLLGRTNRGLATIDEATAGLTPERIAELDQTLDEVATKTHEFAETSAEFVGIGADVGPLIARLSQIARRATAIDELTIRRFFQEEGMLTHIGGKGRKQVTERLEQLEDSQ